MTDILLYGDLANKYGSKFSAKIFSPIETIDCLSANFPTFKSDILKNKIYSIIVDDKEIVEEELLIKKEINNIKIIPVIQGGSGGAKIITGIALIGLSILNPGSAAVIVGNFTTASLSGAVFNIGVGMLFAGFAELLYSPPEGEVDDDKSYMFSGAENNVKQGVPVPVGYGKVLVGSTVISTELNNVNMYRTNQNSIFK